eukprot:CAMPEP_0202350724 /NCGR_PEP_ID=MMETSP1126-20121109/7677_1 /ASSEMBLY_ACC=CAM_ASM_000457 /TAXON_ID=3047 /ORGANISM="Dunaliella tertiolecta, Strain CCMP1320" /LENGTH=252 /DNA_ID=CAMNT_0048942743 /DNA_START=141 /DNA_END=896 /DNA_ORIENTATION=+
MQLHKAPGLQTPRFQHPRHASLSLRPIPQPRISSVPHIHGIRVSTRATAEDPYQVLGIKPDADNNEVNRAFNKKKWEYKSDPVMRNKVEEAHSKLMMAAFNARIRGGTTVPKEVKFADREALFPWKPKRWDATPKIVMIFGGLQLALMSFAFQAPNISKAIGCMLLGIAGNVMKQNAIFPPPTDPDMATEEEAGRPGRNFVRGVLLGLFATCLGLVVFSFPEALYKLFNISLPISSGTAVSLKVAGAAICNW